MFSKLFGQKEVPAFNGNLEITPKPDGFRWIKVFDLELSNMEGLPTYTLRHQLTIGSEIGNVVIADPTISPRHCTFILEQEVVSIIDHGSMNGTIINGTRIPSGKYIILEESDDIRVGDLSLKLKMRSESINEFDIPLIPIEGVLQSSDRASKEIVVEDTIDLAQALASAEIDLKELKDDVKKSIAVVRTTSHATNSLVRVIAVMADFLLAYSILIVFYPFDEFREFLEFVPATFVNLLGVDLNMMWTEFSSQQAQLSEFLKEAYEFLSTTFHIGPLLLLFAMIRLVTTIIFGVSVSEKILSVKFDGNPIWARFGGVLRVLIGLITGPFLIFDLPAIVSRRTFKEVITYTHTDLSSKFIATLGTILYIPFLVCAAVLAPMVQGLELPQPIAVSDRIELRRKVVPAAPTPSPANVAVEGSATETTVAGPPVAAVPVVTALSRSEDSHLLNSQISYDANELEIFPSFKVKSTGVMVKIAPQIHFFQKEFATPVTLEVFKTFDQKELLQIAMKGNFFLFDKFPTINEIVFANQTKGLFTPHRDEKAQAKFANEFINLTKVSFELSGENFVDTMETYTLFVKNLIDYKASFLNLIEYKDFNSITFFKAGNVVFMKFQYMKAKPFDLIIPLIKGDGKILKVTFNKKETYNEESNKFYKFHLDKSDWLLTSHSAVQEIMSPFQVVDFFVELSPEKLSTISPANAQALYGFYFEKSAGIITKDSAPEYELLKESVNSTLKVIDEFVSQLKRKKNAGDIENPMFKLHQNFTDLKAAIDAKNRDYFSPAPLSI